MMALVSMNSPRTVDVDALRNALRADPPPVVVDVRMPFEFAGGHVPTAINIPLPRIASAAEELRGHPEVWIICKSGSRSAGAAKLLADAGLTVVDVGGGTMAWRRGGGPVVREPSLSRLVLPGVVVLTLGLAPHTPEPHIVGKLRWIAGGADGMTLTDWFDVLMHGLPWAWLAWTAVDLVRSVSARRSRTPNSV